MAMTTIRWRCGAAAIVPLLAAAPTPAPAPAPVPPDWAAAAAALFATAPDVPECRAGVLAAAVRADVLERLNAIRALHRLPAVAYAAADEEQAMQAALLMAANGRLSHTPAADWTCHSAAGAAGARSSNLHGGLISRHLGFQTEDMYLAGWLTETDNVLANNVGHRRWMLDPFLRRIAYGRVAQVLPDGSRTDAAAMKVFGFAGGADAAGSGEGSVALPRYVAYPEGDYPARYFDPAALLSFAVVADTATRGGANATVGFAAATVSVRDATGAALAVSNVGFDNAGYGVRNNIRFAVAGLRPGVRYSVRISGVSVRGIATDYGYTFRIVP